MSCARTAEPIEMAFWVWTRVSEMLLDGVHLIALYLASATEPFMSDSDAAFCQITLTIYVS